MQPSDGYLRAVRLVRDSVRDFKIYPFSIPSISSLDELEIDPKVTFLIGENGSGKSTLLEAIAVLAGFNAEGGSKNFRFGTRRSESCLHEFMRPVRSHRRPRDGFFLRAESYFNVATEIERLDLEPSLGDPVIDAYDDARKYAELSLAHLDADSPPEQVAVTKSTLAEALARTKGDRARYRRLAFLATH
jgi:predicted ATPase